MPRPSRSPRSVTLFGVLPSARQVDFVFDGNEIRGLEQNPETKSRWAQMARSGKKVMQFLSEGRYVANVVNGKVTLYGKGSEN
jgi:hypothetical protein